MNDPFEVFYEYLTKSQNIRQFFEEQEGLLLQTIRDDRFTDDQKIHFLGIVGNQIDEVININKLNKLHKKSPNVPTIPKEKIKLTEGIKDRIKFV